MTVINNQTERRTSQNRTTTGVLGWDEKVEAWLDSHHVYWEYMPSISLGQISKEASLANRSRIVQGLSEEVVERYTEAMKKGDKFPPVIVRRSGRHTPEDSGVMRYVNIGGNHRLVAAERAGLPALAGYVVDCEPDLIPLLMFEDNAKHGYPPSEEERIAQAFQLIEGLGYTQSEAARVVGLPVGKVGRYVQVRIADQRAARLGMRDFDSLQHSMRWRLGQIKSDPVFVVASDLVYRFSPSMDEIFRMVTKLNEARSEEFAMTILGDAEEEWRVQYQRRAGGKSGRGVKQTDLGKLRISITNILSIDVEAAVAGCGTEDQRTVLKSRLRQAMRHMRDISRALGDETKD